MLLLAGQQVQAQDKSNRGKEFWVGYGFSGNFFAHPGLSDPVNAQEMTLYISTIQAANVTVSINGTSWTQSLSIPANTADASILIPKSGVNDARILTDGLSTKGIHIVSDVPVAVYAHEYDAMFSAATMLMPVESWGYNYYSVNFYQTKGLSNPPYKDSSRTYNFQDWYDWFYAVATEDNTRLLITPADSTKNGWLPGQTYTVNLNKGEIYTVFGKANLVAGLFVSDTTNSSKDLTGSKVVSVAGADGTCHPIALFSGSGGQHICNRDGGEAMQQQMFPLQAWGTRYLTHHTLANTAGNINTTFRNYYRVSVKDPTTVVKRNGVVLTGLIRNFFYQFVDSTGGDYIEADKPVLVSQYTPNAAQCWMNITPAQLAVGDPEMFYLSPVEQGQKSVTFYSSSHNLISASYANIIIPTAGISSLRVDGAPVLASQIKVHPNNPAYSVAIPNLTATLDQPHTITSDSAFTATVYGIGAYESYGYNIGCNINNLNSFTFFKNVFSSPGSTDTTTCIHTPLRFTIKTAYRLSSINWKISQAGGGISPSTDSLINNPVPFDSSFINNRRYYFYTLQQDFTFNTTGTYYLPVSYTAPEIDNCNNTETVNLRIIVNPGPQANFTISSPSCLTDTIHFNGNSVTTGFNITTYQWNFDDLSTQSTLNAAKKFNTPGIQHVRYRIFADNGCVGDTIKLITINPNPVSNFGATTPICAKDSVRITDTSSISSGSISTWKYDFGDNTTLTRNTNTPFFHTYNAPGNYTIKLITNSNNGCGSDTAYRSVTVNAKPVAKFGYDRNICAGDSIKFSDSSLIAIGSITNRHWDFGDGNTADKPTSAPFYHTYTTSGNYIVSLVASSANGCTSDTFRLTVKVNNKPVTNFSLSGTPCIDSIYKFTSTFPYNASVPASWYWNFDDGNSVSISNSNTVSHAYASAYNNLTVKHAVDLGGGCISDTAFIVIPLINPNPIADFTVKTDTLCDNAPVQFTSANVGVAQWNWSFGNGIGNNVPPFTRLYSSVGNYNIVLSIKDNFGCGSLPLTKTIRINPSPVVNAGTDKFVKSGSSVVMDASISPASSYTFLWTPGTYLGNPASLNPVFTAGNTTKYTLKATDNISHCSTSDDVLINVVSGLFMPNAFTPNKDGLNDKWTIPGLALYPEAVVTIYNRYGQVIYQTGSYYYNPWDGTYKGTPQTNGTYVYVIHLNDAAKQVLKGTVMIIR